MAAWVKNKETFTITISNTSSSASANFTKSQDATKVFIYSVTFANPNGTAGSNDNNDSLLVRASIATGPDRVVVNRDGTSGELLVTVELWEADSTATVTSGQSTITSGNTDVNATIPTSVLANTFQTYSISTDDITDDYFKYVVVPNQTTTTNVNFAINTAGGTVVIDWFNVEHPDINVQRTLTSATNADETVDQTITSVTQTLTLVLGGFTTSIGTDNPRDASWQPFLLNATTVRWQRANGEDISVSTSYVLRAQVITLDATHIEQVEHITISVADATSSNTGAISLVDINLTSIIYTIKTGENNSVLGRAKQGCISNSKIETGGILITTQMGHTQGTRPARLQVVEIIEASAGITGNISETLADITLAATGEVSLSGNISETLADITLAATGKLSNVGSISETLADITLAATGKLSNVGSISETLADITLSSTGLISNIGSISETLADITLSANGQVSNIGFISETLQEITLSAAGQVGDDVTGNILLTLEDIVLSASGQVGESIVGFVSQTLQDITLSASGTVGGDDVTGFLSEVLDAITLFATGFIGLQGLEARLSNVARVALIKRESNVDLVNRSASIEGD